ncbi:MAG: hypothetical protein ACYSYM_06690, partial [Planctomycetota bacterium]
TSLSILAQFFRLPHLHYVAACRRLTHHEEDCYRFPEEIEEYDTFFDELCFIMVGFDRGQRVG